MKQELCRPGGYALRAAFLIGIGIFSIAPVPGAVAQKPAAPRVNVAKDRRAVATFEGRAKAYVKLRNRIKSKLPKLSKDSTPEQIAAHKKAFEDAVRGARVGAKPGDIFTADAAEYLRRLIRTEFKGQDRGEVKETILEADTTGVPLKVNYPYPETKEVSTVPPTVLLKLPQLPREVNYRFVGRHMLLIDKDNGLILDYMLNALP
ncbi:MAG: hypothetical protein H7Z16_02165 [Pyrinomonadaceae bacterium]|nr:hypothetical protein [Pyrinomonadaceae bacterium]